MSGEAVAQAVRMPFAWGEREVFAHPGRRGWSGRCPGHPAWRVVRFASIEAMVATERACIWTLGGLLDDA